MPSTRLPLEPAGQRRLARLLERPWLRRRCRWLLRLVSAQGGRLPVQAERIARRRPAAELIERPGGSPFLRELPGEPARTGPLAGARVAVKDSIDVAGVPSSLGLRCPRRPAAQDAPLVARIRRAGGAIAGKTVMTELGVDGLGAVMHAAMPQNPGAPGYFPGGSSTGTAVALASGRVRFGLGGDGLGSVRIPAAMCGLVGLKPTHGLLPAEGYPSPAPTLDVIGPMARSAADAALLWQVLAQERPRPLDPWRPARVGILAGLPPSLAACAVQEAFWASLERLGCEPVRVRLPGAAHATALGAIAAAYELARTPWSDDPHLSAAAQLDVALGRALTERDGRWLAERRRRLRAGALAALERCGGVFAMPTAAIPPPAQSEALLRGGQDLLLLRALGAFTPFANVTGFPAIALPAGRDERGRPLSIMFVGAPGSEERLLRIGLALEA